MEDKVRVHVFVSGRVQGVFFRENTKNKAKAFGIRGFVRNLPDGRVEAVLEGEKEKIQELLERIKKGPLFSRVDGVEVKSEEYKGEFNDFEVIRD
jgi:acylphosphatase